MDTLWKRKCPICGKEITYQSLAALKHAIVKNSSCIKCSSKISANHCANLSVLLEDSNEAFYWIGFLLADGSFYDNRIRLTLSIKDKEHVLKFAKFINYEGSYQESPIRFGLACKDINIVTQIRNKFDIKDNKTYNPPEAILKFDNDLVYSLLAGFIDGDGNIQHPSHRQDFFLRIKNHVSWLHILKEFGTLVSEKECVKINNSGYAELNVTNSINLQNLKTKILSLNIPIMHRKWDIIDLNFVSKHTKATLLKEEVIELYKSGHRNKEIAEICNTSNSNVCRILKKYKNDN